MTAMFSAQDHDDLDRVLGATGGIPDPADLHALADDAVAQVRRWLAESRDHEADFAARYHVARRTLQRWRVTGDGPPFVRLGARRVAYRLSDAEAWAAGRTYSSRAAELARKAA